MKQIIGLSLLFLGTMLQAQDLAQLGKAPNAKVIAAMTREEKVRLLIGNGLTIPGIPLPPAMAAPPKAGVEGEKVLGAVGTTAAYARLGIPSTIVTDGPAGVRIQPQRPNTDKTFYATAFPIATNLAATWDLSLVQKTGEAMGKEVKEYGMDVLLGPGMNLHRNPLGGRNFEYFSEDPLLTGKMAAAMVVGVQKNGVGTSVKHFAANNHETNRMSSNAKVSVRALREIYLRGFEIVVKEANPWTVMSSYNKLNGYYTSQNSALLQTVLRKDWGFKGLVMSDWFGGVNAVEQMKAGNELLMPGTNTQYKALLEALEKGDLDEKVLDRNLEYMLAYIQKTPTFKKYAYSDQPDLEAHAHIARQVAAEGMVLLKNAANTLPLAPAAKIAVFGNFSYNLVSGGTGSGDVNEAYTITLPQGLEKAGLKMEEALRIAYEKHIAEAKAKVPKNRPFFLPPPPIEELAVDAKTLGDATAADVAIITLGRIAGEMADRQAKDDFYLTTTEQNLLRSVSEAFHAKGKKVVVIINVGGTIETASWRDQVDAILVAWQPGQEAGNAIADVLCGKVNPSGKLPSTFLVRYEDDPSAKNFPGTPVGKPRPGFMGMPEQDLETDYVEGIYVGYRGLDKQNIAPAYPFGFGLSYTSFAYSAIKVSSPTFKTSVTVHVTVRNTGKQAGKEVVQLYLAAPATEMDKPKYELKGFAKTKLLQAGESQVLSFELDARSLASFDEKTAAWVAEKGTYEAFLGASSRDLRGSVSFKLPKKRVVETVSRVLELPK